MNRDARKPLTPFVGAFLVIGAVREKVCAQNACVKEDSSLHSKVR